MRRYNSKLFRVARAIVKDDAEAEDALQDTYLEAYRRIGSFRGESQLVTWLTRIVINQALMRLRRQKRDRVVVPFSGGRGASPKHADIGLRNGRCPHRIAPRRDDASRGAADAGAANRRATRGVSHGFRDARSRGSERRGDCGVSLDPRGDGAHQAVPRESSSARSARPRHGLGNGRGLSVRRRAVRP